MILIGLTGGIGCGKSEVSRLLEKRGAVVVDADLIVRELQQPGGEIFLRMVEMFGEKVLATDGSLDRGAVAKEVFKDAELLKKLNSLIHPVVRRVMNERVESYRATEKIVILDIPLLVENPREGLDGVLVVDLDPQIAIDRIVSQRNMTLDDAKSRVAAQSTREQRLAIADHVVDNSGDRDALAIQVDAAWSWITSLK
ncbi:MAG: dephospho-CoA kinase [Actinobacteria bacterium]|jgi:dephospho-CoA kinase|nr:dephospho-CoA kinase [Actinomycetota bacterium]